MPVAYCHGLPIAVCVESTLVYTQTGSYEETARRLQLDRRTVKSRIDRRN